MCQLRGYPDNGFQCGNGMHGHHILRKGLAGGNKKLLKYLNDPSLRCRICGNHNVSRYADHPQARRIMLIEMNHLTKGRTRQIVEAIPWKTPMPEFSWKALTGED